MNWIENGEVLGSIGEFLAEDIGRGDITTQATVESEVRGLGRFLAKEYLVICGVILILRFRRSRRAITRATKLKKAPCLQR
jgi:nicotinate-nucleotide pyrophosphorylase